jgi:hypothetical protein
LNRHFEFIVQDGHETLPCDDSPEGAGSSGAAIGEYLYDVERRSGPLRDAGPFMKMEAVVI